MEILRQAEETRSLDKYKRKIKPISLFFVIFSVFILLNACIGWSSSPFYDKYTECTLYDITEECKSLRRKVTAIYVFEMIGSLFLVAHGLIGMILIEYMKQMRLIKILNTYTKVALIFYSLVILLRTAMYIKVLVLIAPLELNKPQDFGGFLAVYAENDTLSTIITLVLMVTYLSCFLSSMYMICLTNNLMNFIVEKELEKKMVEE